MNLEQLLSRLKDHKILVEEERKTKEFRSFIFRTHLPSIPFGNNQHVWYTLVLNPDQDFVDREEIEALLRHMWHGSTVFFGDELDE